MKVLIHSDNLNSDEFEGNKFRQTIKGALELVDIQYTTAFIDNFEIAHFVSPDMQSIHFALENRKDVITSALYIEDDERDQFLEYCVKRDGTRKLFLKSKAKRMLNNSNVVLVPSLECKKYLIQEGVTSRIEIIRASVNLAKFDFSREDEKEIFYKYFREDKDKKLVLALGGTNSTREGINTFLEAANNNPNTIFYYIGVGEDSEIRKKYRKYINKAPKNAKFKGLMHSDLYKSALLNAEIVLFPSYAPMGIMTLYEAMAAKCQIIAREGSVPKDLLTNEVNAYLGKFSETLVALVSEYLDGTLKPTIDAAYQEVSSYSLRQFGTDIKRIYEKELTKKGRM